MDIITRVNRILSKIDTPHYYLKAKDEESYIVFYIQNEKKEGFSSNKNRYNLFYIQISIFSKDLTRWIDLRKEVRELFESEGYKEYKISEDLYEKDTGYYHKGIRYLYVEGEDE